MASSHVSAPGRRLQALDLVCHCCSALYYRPESKWSQSESEHKRMRPAPGPACEQVVVVRSHVLGLGEITAVVKVLARSSWETAAGILQSLCAQVFLGCSLQQSFSVCSDCGQPWCPSTRGVA